MLHGRGEAGSAVVGSFVLFARQGGESVLLSLSRNGIPVPSSTCTRFYGTNYTLFGPTYAARVCSRNSWLFHIGVPRREADSFHRIMKSDDDGAQDIACVANSTFVPRTYLLSHIALRVAQSCAAVYTRINRAFFNSRALLRKLFLLAPRLSRFQWENSRAWGGTGCV